MKKNGKGKNEVPLRPKLINGKVWVPDEIAGLRRLPEDDPSYRETFLRIDVNQRFAELLDWVYHRNDNGQGKNGKNGKSRMRNGNV